MKFLTLPLKGNKTKPTKKKKKQTKNIISKTSEKFSLVTVATNYHKLSLLPLVFRP